MRLIDRFKDKVVYHVSDSDLDGVGSRVIAEYYIKPIAKEYIPLNTVERDMRDFQMENAKKADITIFTDITPTLELYNELKDLDIEFYIFDHHQSGRDILGVLDNYYFDLDKCGCKIFFDTILEGKRKKNIVNQFVNLVNTYDLFNDSSPSWIDAKGLHNTLYGSVNWRAYNRETDTERYIKFIELALRKFDKWDSFRFTSNEIKMIKRADKKEEMNYKQALKTMRKRKDSEGNTYCFFEVQSKLSFVANKLIKKFPEINYWVGLSVWKKDNMKMSIRSSQFDTTCISKKWGGGGHPQASGFEFSNIDDFQKFKEGKIHLL